MKPLRLFAALLAFAAAASAQVASGRRLVGASRQIRLEKVTQMAVEDSPGSVQVHLLEHGDSSPEQTFQRQDAAAFDTEARHRDAGGPWVHGALFDNWDQGVEQACEIEDPVADPSGGGIPQQVVHAVRSHGPRDQVENETQGAGESLCGMNDGLHVRQQRFSLGPYDGADLPLLEKLGGALLTRVERLLGVASVIVCLFLCRRVARARREPVIRT